MAVKLTIIYCLPGPAWASTEGKWSICCCSWPRLQLWNLRPGNKCCQKIGHGGAGAREYPSFPSSCWDEMLWWEVYMEMKGYFRAQFRSAVYHCRDGKAGTWCSWLRAVQSTERMHACLPASARLTYSPSSVTQDPSPENSAAAVGWVSPHGFPYEDKHLWKCPHD